MSLIGRPILYCLVGFLLGAHRLCSVHLHRALTLCYCALMSILPMEVVCILLRAPPRAITDRWVDVAVPSRAAAR